MAKKENKVSITKFEEFVKDKSVPAHACEYEGFSFEITPVISLKEALGFVKEVVENCMGEEYMPELKDFLIRCNILSRYTNISLPSNIEKRYECIYATGLVEYVLELISDEQFEAIERAINDKLSYKAHSDISAVNAELIKLAGSMEQVRDGFADAFKGISPADISGVLSTIAKNGAMDEAKLVEALIQKG